VAGEEPDYAVAADNSQVVGFGRNDIEITQPVDRNSCTDADARLDRGDILGCIAGAAIASHGHHHAQRVDLSYDKTVDEK